MPDTIDLNDLEDIGIPISGLRIDTHRFVAVMPFARLMNLVSNPIQAANQRMRDTSSQLSDYYSLHAEIQRQFDKTKKDNANAYAEYVMRIQGGEDGDTPSIDLYTPELLHVIAAASSDHKAKLVWPHGLTVVPYDGETQLAARFIAAQTAPDTKQMPVVVTITHGKSVDYARQCFHDRNAYQKKATVGVAMAMDARDPLIAVVREIEEAIPGLRGKITWRSRQVPAGGNFVAAAPFVRTALSCFAHGIGGVQMQHADLPASVSAAEFSRRAAIWFGRVMEALEPFMRDREQYVASSPAIWAALGAMGKPLADAHSGNEASLEAHADELISRLKNVDWRKDEHWVGIAVKSTAKGYSFAGGAKDSGSVAFKALNDKADANFARIRSVKKAA